MTRIVLVRHGQASFGAADYDRLSPVGLDQSHRVGIALAARGVRPTHVVSGGMRRHQETATAARDSAGWAPPIEVDSGWAEYDHVEVLSKVAEAGATGSVADLFRMGLDRWLSGNHDDYSESFATFVARVEASLGSLVARLGPDDEAVVFTSGGPMSWAAAHLLGGGHDLWRRLNVALVNTGVTVLRVGSRGPSVLSVNDHGHLQAGHEAELMTWI